MSLIVSDDSICYSYYPKMEKKWRERFITQANKVAKDFGLTVEFRSEEVYQIEAIYSGTRIVPVFNEEEGERIWGEYFGDFH